MCCPLDSLRRFSVSTSFILFLQELPELVGRLTSSTSTTSSSSTSIIILGVAVLAREDV